MAKFFRQIPALLQIVVRCWPARPLARGCLAACLCAGMPVLGARMVQAAHPVDAETAQAVATAT